MALWMRSEWTQPRLHFSRPALAAAAPTRSPHFAGRDAGSAELVASDGNAGGDDAGFAVICRLEKLEISF